MGVAGLLPLIKKSAPHLLRNLPHPTTLAGTRLAIDGHMLLHRFWHAPKPGATPRGPNGRPNHHVQYFNNFLELCDYLHVRPTIVFDYGVRPLAKQRVVHVKRAAARSRQVELHRTAQTTVDGLERHLDMFSLQEKAGEAAGPMGYQHLPFEALETEESRLVERTLGSGAAVQESEAVPKEFQDLLDEPLETEETRLLEQAFALKEQSPPLLVDRAALGSDADAQPRLLVDSSTGSPQKNVALETMSRFGRFFWQKISDQLDSFRSRTSEPTKDVTDPHGLRPEVMERPLSPEELARNHSPPDLPPSTPPPPPTLGAVVPTTTPLTPRPSPAPPIPQHDLNSLQSFLGDLIQSTSPLARPPTAPTVPSTHIPPTPTLPPPTDPTALLGDIKPPRTNIHRLLVDTLVATTQPTFNPITSLSSARSQAHLESQRLERTAAGLPHHVLYDVLLLLRSRGVPTVLTPNFTEAEQLCGALAHLRVVDYAVSDDSDTGVFFPDAHVIRSFFQYSKRPVVLGPMRDLAVALALVPEGASDVAAKNALVDFSILAGCDYSGKIPGVGPVNAIKLIKQFGSIERILEAKPELRVKAEANDTWDPVEARTVFNNEYLNTDELLELVNEAAEVAEMPLTRADPRVPEALAYSSFWSPETAAGRAPTEIEVLDAMGIRAFDAEAYVQNLMALEPQV